jgi:hypothetical protein
MGRGGGHGRKATRTEQRHALREKDATVEEPIARDRLYEELILGKGFPSWHLFSPFHAGGTWTY